MWRGCWSDPLWTPPTKGRDPQDPQCDQTDLTGRLSYYLALPCTLGQTAAVPPQQISLNQYTQELDRLRTVAEACAQELSQRDAASGQCDPSLVGPDVVVSITNGKRAVSFEWLRDALRLAASAETGEEPTKRRERSGSSVMRVRGWRR